VVDETVRGASDRVKRTDIRSPVDGIVNTLEVNTIGAYVDPGRVIAGIVPTADMLLVEAKISPRDVAFVRRGQPAIVKVTAYDFSIFGGLEGIVENISADSLVEKEKGETYYLVQVKTDQVRAGAQRKGLSDHPRHGRLGRNHDRQQDSAQLSHEADQQGAHRGAYGAVEC
jgi:adhesin transport system membrane fusion protein